MLTLSGDGVNLTIMSSAEVNVGIFAACLPPLRLAFDGLMKRLRGPATTTNRSKSGPLTYELQRSRTVVEANDYGSECSILAEQGQANKDGMAITKTVNVHVQDEEGQLHDYSPPFASPRMPERAGPRKHERHQTIEIASGQDSPPG